MDNSTINRGEHVVGPTGKHYWVNSLDGNNVYLQRHGKLVKVSYDEYFKFYIPFSATVKPDPKANKYTVMFMDDSMTYNIDDQMVPQGSFIAEPELTDRNGYVFLGWWEKSSDTKWKFNYNMMPDHDLLLTAKWKHDTEIKGKGKCDTCIFLLNESCGGFGPCADYEKIIGI